MKTTVPAWNYCSLGGAIRVKIDNGRDLQRLGELDEKYWTVLSCPVADLEFDKETLRLIDSDNDGKIRVGEMVGAARWLCSVIKDKDQYAEIVSSISRYANTQNKVNDADFSANNPALVEIERISRYVFAPATPTNNLQTVWFFERARGQYKTLRAKEGFTKSRQKAFDLKYPKKQVVTKVELAKYVNAWQEIYNGKNLAVGPHIVVRGNEKNYARFINYNLPDAKHIDVAWFEDTIAKAILFKTADKRYGTKLSGNHIGELKQVVVPYTLSLLNIITEGQLDLYRIWKNQSISPALSDFIYDLMKQVNEFILRATASKFQ